MLNMSLIIVIALFLMIHLTPSHTVKSRRHQGFCTFYLALKQLIGRQYTCLVL